MTELKLYCTIATQPVVEMLIPRFEAEHGCRFSPVWNTAPAMVKRLQSGEHGDVLLLNRAGSETMIAAGRLIKGSQTPIASSATAIAVKAGARHPASRRWRR
jgi:molybdate transport system substrate-binding protein